MKKVKDGENAAEIKTAAEALSQALQKIGEALYRTQGGAAPTTPPEEKPQQEENPDHGNNQQS